eukprot:scaffold748_cov251-Pinguiococcus_pyrenoidosus.AAC.32
MSRCSRLASPSAARSSFCLSSKIFSSLTKSARHSASSASTCLSRFTSCPPARDSSREDWHILQLFLPHALLRQQHAAPWPAYGHVVGVACGVHLKALADPKPPALAFQHALNARLQTGQKRVQLGDATLNLVIQALRIRRRFLSHWSRRRHGTLRHHLDIQDRAIGHLRGPGSKFERVLRLLQARLVLRQANENAGVRIATQGVTQNPRELGLPIRHKGFRGRRRSLGGTRSLRTLREGCNHLAQRQEPRIDVACLPEPRPRRHRLLHPLGPRKIRQGESGYDGHVSIAVRAVRRPDLEIPPPLPHRQREGEHRMRAAARAVHGRRASGATVHATAEKAHSIRIALHQGLRGPLQHNASSPVRPQLQRRTFRRQQIPHLLIVNL